MKELDNETGLYYYGARYYASWLGRWTAVDPLAEKTMQAYTYANNKPIQFIDIGGREAGVPPLGFRLGFNLGFGSNGFNFNVTASVGIEYKTSNFQAVAFASSSLYGGQQLGTSFMTRGLQFDVTVGTYATVGNSTGSAHNFYTLNPNSSLF